MEQSELVGRRYILQEMLGEGGMGAVYRALDRLSGQPVALKRVRTQTENLQYNTRDDSTDVRLTLAREYKALASLRHPNIISVLDYGFEGQQPYIAMELVENPQTLTEAASGQSLSAKIDLTLQILQALAYLHRRGIIHRDLKPSNVLVAAGRAKLLDFGIAVMREDDTGEGMIAGTPGYMSPELWTTGIASRASDLYAVGVILYEMFAERLPFAADSFAMLAVQVMTLAPDLTLIDAPAGVVSVIGHLLMKDPAQRPQDVNDVIADLCSAAGLPLPPESAAARESFLQAAHFVGREAEMQQLHTLLDQTLAGQGGVCLIGGESGVGKSRLLDELRTLALVNHALVLRGQEVDEAGLPYQVWQGPLRWLSLLTELDDAEAAVLKGVVADLPDLLGRRIADAPEVQPQAAQARVLSVIETLFRRQTQPLVAILEDMHWSGDESLALLRQLSGVTASLPLLLIASYRDDEKPDLPAQLPGAHLLKLSRLSPDDIAELSRSMLGAAGEKPDLVELLQKQSEGNVFFVVEVMRALAQEAGQLDRIGRDTLPTNVITGGLKNIIRRRLQRVPAEALPLLKVAAVAGRQLDLRVLREVLGVDAPLDRMLAVGAEAAILEVDGKDWRFAHNKLQEGVLEDMTPVERRALHSEVARALEKLYEYSARTAAALAYHWGMAEEKAKEEHYAALAGEQALHSGAYGDARDALQRALDLQPYVEVNQRRTALLLRQLGDTYFWGFWEYEQAAALYRQSLDLCQQIFYRSGTASNLYSLGNAVCELGRYAEARGYYEEALKVALDIRAQNAALAALTGLARLLVREEQAPDTALEYLALVMHNPATDALTAADARQLVETLRANQPADLVEAAFARGKELKLRDVAQKILG